VAYQRGQAARQGDQHRQVQPGGNPHLFAHRDQVFGTDVARRAGRERAAAQPTQCGIEALGAGIEGGDHIGQSQPAGVVEMQGQRIGRDQRQGLLHQSSHLAWIGHARGVGQRDASAAQVKVAADQIEHLLHRLVAVERASERGGHGAVEPCLAPRQRSDLREAGEAFLGGHAHVGQVMGLAGGHHQVELVRTGGKRALGTFQVRHQRHVDGSRSALQAGEHLGCIGKGRHGLR
jgi:hypothetical protein